MSIKNRTDDTTQQSLVIQLLETRITELVKRESDKNCIIECLTKTILNKTNRKETLQRWDGSSNQNIRFTVEALNNENKKSDKTHHKKKVAIVIGDSIANNINERGLTKSNKVLVKKFPGATSRSYYYSRKSQLSNQHYQFTK